MLQLLVAPQGPGAFEYSNDAYDVVAILLEKVHAAPFERLMRDEVLVPACLDGTRTWIEADKTDPEIVAEPLNPFPRRLMQRNYGALGSVGMLTTAAQLVRLPREMQDGERYPAVHLLDGGLTFPLLAGMYEYLHLAGTVLPMILVGVSCGTHDWRQGNRRSRDFTAPSDERAFWGGAERFDAWFAEVLLPLIESRYPADPERRILFGQGSSATGRPQPPSSRRTVMMTLPRARPVSR